MHDSRSEQKILQIYHPDTISGTAIMPMAPEGLMMPAAQRSRPSYYHSGPVLKTTGFCSTGRCQNMWMCTRSAM